MSRCNNYMGALLGDSNSPTEPTVLKIALFVLSSHMGIGSQAMPSVRYCVSDADSYRVVSPYSMVDEPPSIMLTGALLHHNHCLHDYSSLPNSPFSRLTTVPTARKLRNGLGGKDSCVDHCFACPKDFVLTSLRE
ncbi:uncharacterized protein CLUP02_00394 [Colletotrichum lupini]|uniref:Uncharacterized protein n=1 Tax=Colletotrichum lupini TaxID=145971 RepID=A0A9Q8W706_9PEZI|nr:uncharacterized protein CLUP02_00394 [Colletotrichum lupini]UQC73748.1 hypothetical protein CLUP02_00394 [Colletotrichum lupini]